jgi:hypothetical protein
MMEGERHMSKRQAYEGTAMKVSAIAVDLRDAVKALLKTPPPIKEKGRRASAKAAVEPCVGRKFTASLRV